MTAPFRPDGWWEDFLKEQAPADATATTVRRFDPGQYPVLKSNDNPVPAGRADNLRRENALRKVVSGLEAGQAVLENLPSPFGDAAQLGAAVREASAGNTADAGLYAAAAALPLIPVVRVKVGGKWKEFTGPAHPFARMDAEDLLGDLSDFAVEDGFLQGKKFLTRDEAYKVAKKEGQTGGTLKTQDRMKQSKQLYSEGLMGTPSAQADEYLDLKEALDKNGGFTYDPFSSSFVESGGYMVGGVPGQKGWVGDEITQEAFEKFRKENAALLNKEDHFIGGWRDPKTGKYHLDISERVSDRDRAMQLLKDRGEIAAWDLDTMSELRLPETPKVAVGETPKAPEPVAATASSSEQGFGLGGHVPPQEPMEYYFGRGTDPAELHTAYDMSRTAFDPRGAYRRFVDIGRSYPGAAPWYDTRAMYRDAADEIGEGEAAKRVNALLGGFMPSSTARSAPPSNLRRAFLWQRLARDGQITPEILRTHKVIPAEGFGHFAQNAHQDALARFLERGSVDPVNNPKPASFGANLTGNHEVGTFDTVMSRLFAELEPGAAGRFLAETPTPSGGVDYSPRKQFYEALERGLADAAHDARGMGLLDDVPAELGPTGAWQSLGWHGKTRSAEYGSMDDIWKRIRKQSAELWGVSEKEANRRIWQEGAVPLLPEGAAPMQGLVPFD